MLLDHDDKIIIPSWIEKLTLEELEIEIQKLEEKLEKEHKEHIDNY